MRSESALSTEEQVYVEEDVPEEFQAELHGIQEKAHDFSRVENVKGIGDIARNPLKNPLATLAAALVIATIGVQIAIVAVDLHPGVGALVAGVAGVAYALAKRVWMIQRRFLVRELARAGELDRLRD